MDKLTPEFWLQLLVAFASVVALYGAIKGDLRVMHERIRTQRERLDEHLADHGHPRRRVDDTNED